MSAIVSSAPDKRPSVILLRADTSGVTSPDQQIPQKVYSAMLEYMAGLAPDEAKEANSQGNLWLAASWKQAQAMGMSEREYCRWIQAGLWNIAGEPGVSRSIETFRALAGRRGHLIAMAGISAEAAVAQATQHGIRNLIEGCEAVIGLMDLGSDLLEDEPEPEAAQPPKPSERIDFS